MKRKLFSLIVVLSLSLMNALSVFASERSVTGVTYTEPTQSTAVEQDSTVTSNTEISPQAIGIGQITLKRVDGSNYVFELSVSLLMPETITDLQYRVNWGDGSYTTGSGSDAIGKKTWSDDFTLVYATAGVYKPTVNIQVKTTSGSWQQINVTPPNVAVVL